MDDFLGDRPIFLLGTGAQLLVEFIWETLDV